MNTPDVSATNAMDPTPSALDRAREWFERHFAETLMRQLTLTHGEGDRIRESALQRLAAFQEEHEGMPLDLARQEVEKLLVHEAAKKCAIVGAVTSLPFRLPLVGLIGPFIVAIGIYVSFLIRSQLELVYAVAAIHGDRRKDDDMRAVAFILVGLSDYEDIKQYAAKLGVNLTLKKFVSKLAGVVAVEIVSYGLRGLYGRHMSRVVAQKSALIWPIRFVGSTLGAFFAYRSTVTVGNRAREFFGNEGEKAI